MQIYLWYAQWPAKLLHNRSSLSFNPQIPSTVEYTPIVFGLLKMYITLDYKRFVSPHLYYCIRIARDAWMIELTIKENTQ